MKQKLYTWSLWFIVACIAIFFIAAIPRSIELFNHNFVFGYDQGKHWLAAKSIIVDHKFPLIGDEVGGARGFFQGSGWFYVLAVFYVFFAGNPYGGIVLMFLSGMLTVGLAVWMFEKTWGKTEAVCVGLTLAISPILIESSRLTWPPHIIPPLTVLALFAISKIVKGAYQYIPPLFFVVAAMGHFEMATAGTMFFALLIYAVPYVIAKKVPFKTVLTTMLVWCIPFFPLIVFDLRHNFLNTRGMLETIAGPRQVQTDFSMLVANHWMIFANNITHAFATQILTTVGLCVFLGIGLLQFFDKKMDRKRKIFLGFLYSFPVVLFGILCFYKNDLWLWWLYELYVIVAVLGGMTLAWMLKKRKILRWIGIAVLVLMLGGWIKDSIRFWKYDYPDYGGVAKIKGKTDAIDFVFADAKTKDFGLFFFTPPIYTYAYDFTNWWWGTKKYGYVAPQEKKSVYYLIAEPDPEKPWTYKGWMETAVTGGTDVARWTLPSGFVVVKRTMP